MPQCNETFDEIARALGNFTCQNAPAVVHLRNPFGLSNWTLPVLELMMVVSAIVALWWGMRRLRRDGDPTNLVLWFGSIVYLLITEIPLYFPDLFGLQDQIGVVFDHNVFTVQFMYERLPLYIVALYPAVIMLAYEIVRALGVFRTRGILVGAVCVGFVHNCFYEVFDQLGPQLRWWAWNTDNASNSPMLSSVPMTSMFIFATLSPAVFIFLVQLLVGRRAQNGRTFTTLSLLWRTLAAGALVSPAVVILSIPTSAFAGDEPNTTAQAILFSIELVLFAAVALPVLARQWLAARRGEATGAELPNAYVRLVGPLYLGVLGVLWLSALPDFFGAVGGVTSDGTPVGSVWYAAVAFGFAAVAVGITSVGPRRTRVAETVEHAVG